MPFKKLSARALLTKNALSYTPHPTPLIRIINNGKHETHLHPLRGGHADEAECLGKDGARGIHEDEARLCRFRVGVIKDLACAVERVQVVSNTDGIVR